jgi:hypothetical protein
MQADFHSLQTGCAPLKSNLLTVTTTMNKNILKQFTFGFEIEGNFSEKLADKLEGDFKEDGSVGSDERIKLPAGFKAIDLGEGEEECGSCDGRGQYHQDCNCDGETHCEHEHRVECFTDTQREDCETRYPNRDLLTMLRQRHSPDNCNHDCGDCPVSYPCEDDDDYHLVDCNDCNGSGNNENRGLAQEYASDKFNTIEALLKELTMFKSGSTKPNHIWNKTCGLHLHIGKKPTNKLSYKQVWNATANMDFLRALYDQASNWCACQRKRLLRDNDHYYQMFKNPIDLIETYQHQYPLRSWGGNEPNEKFRFLRFHENYKTLEFRFLSPCEHKVDNVEKLISFLTDYLGANNEYKSQAKVTDEPIHEVLNISIPVHKKGYFLDNANLAYQKEHYSHTLSMDSMFTERAI